LSPGPRDRDRPVPVSFDHRWIDGAQAARFMTDLVAIVENPGLLMAGL